MTDLQQLIAGHQFFAGMAAGALATALGKVAVWGITKVRKVRAERVAAWERVAIDAEGDKLPAVVPAMSARQAAMTYVDLMESQFDPWASADGIDWSAYSKPGAREKARDTIRASFRSAWQHANGHLIHKRHMLSHWMPRVRDVALDVAVRYGDDDV